jgi:acyl carrier protein
MASVTVDAVREFLMDSLKLHETYDRAEIDADGQLFGDGGLGLDSLDALQLAVDLDSKFGVGLDEEQAQEVFRSLRTLTDHINRQG